MQLTISSRKVNVTPDVKKYVEEKINKITKVFDEIISVRVELSREAKRDDGKTFACEILVYVPGKTFHVGRERGAELLEAVDLAEQTLTSQLKSFKEKIIDESRQSKEVIKMASEDIKTESDAVAEMDYDNVDVEILCEKCQTPMSLEEAIEQMKLLDQDFYVFINKTTGETSTVYRKADGRFGVIVENR